MKTKLSIILLILLIAPMTMVSAIRPHYVYDNADVVSVSIEKTMNFYCELVDTATTAEIVVVTLQSLPEGKTAEETRLYYYNDVPLDGVKGIGKAGKDNGVLILLVMETHDWQIEVGYGCEGQLTDAECGRIGRDIMVPQFQNGNFGDGLYFGVKEVAKELGYVATVVITETSETNPTTEELPEWVLIIAAIAIVLVVLFIISLASEGGGSYSGGSSHSSGSGSGGSSGGGGFGGGGSGGGGGGGRWNLPPPKHEVAPFPSGLALFFAFNEMLTQKVPTGTFICPICKKETPYSKEWEFTENSLHKDGYFKDTLENRLCLVCGALTTSIVGMLLLETMAQYQDRLLAEKREREEEERREREEQECRRKRQREEEEERSRRRRSEESSYHRSSSSSFGGGSSFGDGHSGGGGGGGKW